MCHLVSQILEIVRQVTSGYAGDAQPALNKYIRTLIKIIFYSENRKESSPTLIIKFCRVEMMEKAKNKFPVKVKSVLQYY